MRDDEISFKYIKSCINADIKPDFEDFRYKRMRKNTCEVASGEVVVDTRGYVPLQQLLIRCGIGREQEKIIPNWSVDDCGVNKFNDRLEMQQKINDILEVVNNREERTQNGEINKQSEVSEEQTKSETTTDN